MLYFMILSIFAETKINNMHFVLSYDLVIVKK